jgi:glycosyltransferase involved in cell wall biosynthesis
VDAALGRRLPRLIATPIAMQVMLDASPLGAGRGGDETYLRGLIEGLSVIDLDGTTFPVLLATDEPVPETIRDRTDFPIARVPRRPGPWHFGWTLPTSTRRWGGVDLVHSVTHTAPAAWHLPSAVTVGDLSFLHRPQDYPRSVRIRLNTLVPRQVRHARVVLAPSEFSRADIIDSYGIDASRVHVVPNCVRPGRPVTDAEAEHAAVTLASAGVREPFVLYLGNLHPRKNVQRLTAAYRGARATSDAVAQHQLVIAGRPWWHPDDHAGPAPDGVIRLGAVSDVVRRHLLERATALAYVSLFEGFGLPPLEAMSAGTPVLGSRIPALEEVCGDAAMLVDPFDVDAIADGLVRLVESPALRERFVSRGLARAGRYDVERTGRLARAAFREGACRTA